MATTFLVYALVDPRTKQWRYIGKSSQGLERPRQHAHRAALETSHKASWIKQLQALGLRYEIEVVEEFISHEGLYEAEQEWIARAVELGIPLTNLKDRGPGASGLSVGFRKGSRHTNAAKMKIGLGARRPCSAQKRDKIIARKREPAAAARARVQMLAAWTDTDSKLRQAVAARYGRPLSLVTKAKLSVLAKQRVISPETRAKMIETRRARQHG
jgi:hypothetical protein